MAKETIEQLSAQLTELLKDVDAAIAARMQGARGAARRRREQTEERGVVATALRWLRRSPPPEERPRKHA